MTTESLNACPVTPFADWTAEHWQHIRKTSNAWWEGKLDRALLPITLIDETCNKPTAPAFNRGSFADLQISPQQMVDRLAWDFSRMTFMGDAFPRVNMACSGPGVLATLLGAQLHGSHKEDTIWFTVDKIVPITELHLELDLENPWFKRLLEIGHLVHERWQDRVLVSAPDLGGALDVLSTFRPAEELAFDLYDHPEDVLRVIGEIEAAWHQVFNLFHQQMSPANPGYTAWCGIYSDVPYYIMQCDFAYMISPQMFEQFVRPTLVRDSQKLGRAFYHLDGVGQLAHLDSLLQIESLNGVQWIFGAGQKPCREWGDVYQRILAGGKRAQIAGSPDDLLYLAEQLGERNKMVPYNWETQDRDAATRIWEQNLAGSVSTTL